MHMAKVCSKIIFTTFLNWLKKKIQLAVWHFGKYEQENDMFIYRKN